jgi:hypothetical protein
MRTKTGGRAVGTPNKVTATIKDSITAIIENSINQFEDDLEALEPKERLMVLIKLLEFAIPKNQVLEIARVKVGIEAEEAEYI